MMLVDALKDVWWQLRAKSSGPVVSRDPQDRRDAIMLRVAISRAAMANARRLKFYGPDYQSAVLIETARLLGITAISQPEPEAPHLTLEEIADRMKQGIGSWPS